MNHRLRKISFGGCLASAICVSNLGSSGAMAQDAPLPDLNLTFPGDEQKPQLQPAEPTPYANPQSPENQSLSNLTQIAFNARLTQNGEDIKQGLIWRIYSPVMGNDNKLPLVATVDGGSAHFNLEPGDYIVHVAFGRAAAIRRISVQKGLNLNETFVLDAGGLELNASLPEGKINNQFLRFSIYSDDSENDETSLILSDIKPNTVIRLKAGTYHVVSNYGTANAITRSEIRVDAGKVTEATMQHHAAQVTLKLVRQEGGEAMADTSWSITNDSGDIVRETVGAYASLVLAEGDYVAIAKNKDQIFQKEFSVTSGHDEEVNVVAEAQNTQPVDGSMD